jgi:hypothetical protein
MERVSKGAGLPRLVASTAPFDMTFALLWSTQGAIYWITHNWFPKNFNEIEA